MIILNHKRTQILKYSQWTAILCRTVALDGHDVCLHCTQAAANRAAKIAREAAAKAKALKDKAAKSLNDAKDAAVRVAKAAAAAAGKALKDAKASLWGMRMHRPLHMRMRISMCISIYISIQVSRYRCMHMSMATPIGSSTSTSVHTPYLHPYWMSVGRGTAAPHSNTGLPTQMGRTCLCQYLLHAWLSTHVHTF